MRDDGLPSDEELDAAARPRASMNGASVIALAASAVPFCLSFHFGSFDSVPWIGGGIAIVSGGIAIANARRRRELEPPIRSVAGGVLALVLGVFHVGRGAMAMLPVDMRPAALEELAGEGYEHVELTPDPEEPGRFTFVGYHEGSFCQGVVTIAGTRSNRSTSRTATCSDVEPPERAAASCRAGRLVGCATAARVARQSTPPDLVAAEDFAQTGCDGGQKSSCFELGFVLSRTEVTDPASLARAVIAYRAGCDAGSPASCNNLGVLLRRGAGAPADASASCDAFERACTLENYSGCGGLADCYSSGVGRAENPVAAFENYDLACGHGETGPCVFVALLRMKGRGTAADPSAGSAALRTMCEADEPVALACVELGFALHTGDRGVAADRAAALVLFDRACELRDGSGCRDAAIYHRDGLGGAPRDPARATELFRSGCSLGDQESCRLATSAR